MTETSEINERHNVNGYDLHVTGEDDDVEIWLNTEVADFDGLCIGGGESRQKAVEEAIRTLEGVLGVLREGK